MEKLQNSVHEKNAHREAALREKYPLHCAVWNNNYREVERLLANKSCNIESTDPRGRTALHLAVTLGHFESARALFRSGADANAENSKHWTVVQEAVSTGDPELLQVCLQFRDMQRFTGRVAGIPDLLKKLKEAPDFYVEMKWEFTSWLPLVSRMCPSDTYKVWKSGSCVRIDTTLLGFDNMNWQRGRRSFVFKGEETQATLIEIDHDGQQSYVETLQTLPNGVSVNQLLPSDDTVAARLTHPIITTYIDTDNITFERIKSGIWGWRSDKVETINGYEAKAFSAANVNLLTKSRTEHLSEQDKERTKNASTRSPLEIFLGAAEQHQKALSVANSDSSVTSSCYNPCAISLVEYFDETVDLGTRDIGRPIDQKTKVQKFKANLSLCENYPLSLQEQVMPIIDLMAANNAHFRKLRDFITLQLPSGFPIKIEIPLFHVLNVRVTFGNIFASDTAAPHVTCVKEAGSMMCAIDDQCFESPAGYSVVGAGALRRDRYHGDEDDQLLQYAIQQSLMEPGSENDEVTLAEAVAPGVPANSSNVKTARRDNWQAREDRMLQRALEESLGMKGNEEDALLSMPVEHEPFVDQRLQMALEESQRDIEERQRRQAEEDEELQRVLQLSLVDK